MSHGGVVSSPAESWYRKGHDVMKRQRKKKGKGKRNKGMWHVWQEQARNENENGRS